MKLLSSVWNHSQLPFENVPKLCSDWLDFMPYTKPCKHQQCMCHSVQPAASSLLSNATLLSMFRLCMYMVFIFVLDTPVKVHIDITTGDNINNTHVSTCDRHLSMISICISNRRQQLKDYTEKYKRRAAVAACICCPVRRRGFQTAPF